MPLVTMFVFLIIIIDQVKLHEANTCFCCLFFCPFVCFFVVCVLSLDSSPLEKGGSFSFCFWKEILLVKYQLLGCLSVKPKLWPSYPGKYPIMTQLYCYVSSENAMNIYLLFKAFWAIFLFNSDQIYEPIIWTWPTSKWIIVKMAPFKNFRGSCKLYFKHVYFAIHFTLHSCFQKWYYFLIIIMLFHCYSKCMEDFWYKYNVFAGIISNWQ